MSDLPCRVAKLEAKLQNETNSSENFRTEVKRSLESIESSIHEMQLQREKQVGFIAGVSAVIGVMVTAAGYLFNRFYQ